MAIDRGYPIDTGRRNMLDVVLDVHMTTTGAMERSLKEYHRDIKFLKLRIARWEPAAHKRFRMFDEAVRQLVMTVANEAECEEFWAKHGGRPE